MATIDFPPQLPKPLRNGYGMNHVSPMMRSELATGRARQRRRYTSVPTIVSVSWILTQPQSALFESWFRYDIVDGAEWFNATLRTPVGFEPYECRFAEMYSGPDLIGKTLWRFTAELEIRERQTVVEGWSTIAPNYVLEADIFDKAMNMEWPAA